jgi:hypothetical protein
MINRANYIAIFEHPRLGERMRVSTFVLAEPCSFDIMAAPDACYVAETQIWRGDDGDERLVHIHKHHREEDALPLHESIVRRSLGLNARERP